MPRQRHYVNRATGGQTVFLTTTVLDFVPAFARYSMRSAMVKALATECRLARAKLHSYVVMPNHIHLVAELHESTDVRQFARRLKSETAKKMRPLLLPSEQERFSQQTGLNRHVFWKRGFRSIGLLSEKVFWQKVRYIHENPVRAKLAPVAGEYAWSSAPLFSSDQWNMQDGLDLRSIETSDHWPLGDS